MQQRYVLYYLAARILLALVIRFVFPDVGFLNFLQTYRRYLIIVSGSYASYTSLLRHTEKKYQEIQQALRI